MSQFIYFNGEIRFISAKSLFFKLFRKGYSLSLTKGEYKGEGEWGCSVPHFKKFGTKGALFVKKDKKGLLSKKEAMSLYLETKEKHSSPYKGLECTKSESLFLEEQGYKIGYEEERIEEQFKIIPRYFIK